MAKKPVVLIIRDGWGVNPGGQATAQKDGNATLLAHTPFHDEMLAAYPKGFLSASGLDVGLPDGQMGNSEVGHLNLGAGRVVYQDLTRINKAIAEGTLAQNPVFTTALEKAKSGRLHFIGLVSDGGVHSHQDQLIAMIRLAHQAGVKDIMIHAITDGRDTSPTGGEGYLAKVEDEAAKCGARIATVIGRYFAMDRDKRWDRVKLAWDAIVLGKGEPREILASEAVADYYRKDKTDEFMPPMIFAEADSVMTNTPGMLTAMGRMMTHLGVKPEIEAFDTGHLWYAKQLVEDGVLHGPALVQLCMGVPWGAPDDLNTFMAMVNNVPQDWTFSAFALGRNQMAYAAAAVLAGGNVRVGLEDNLWLGKGQLATNAQLVERAANIIENMGARVIGPDEVRKKLGLTKRAPAARG